MRFIARRHRACARRSCCRRARRSKGCGHSCNRRRSGRPTGPRGAPGRAIRRLVRSAARPSGSGPKSAIRTRSASRSVRSTERSSSKARRAAAAAFPLGLPLGAGQQSVVPIELSISFSDLPALADVDPARRATRIRRIPPRRHDRRRRGKAGTAGLRADDADERGLTRRRILTLNPRISIRN